jgi:hypothetical protein
MLPWAAEKLLTLSKYGQTPVKIMLKPRDMRNMVKYIIRIQTTLSLFSCGVSKPSSSSGRHRLKNKCKIWERYKSLWRGSINKVIDFLDIIHCPVLYLKRRFGDWTLSPSSGKKKSAQLDPFRWSGLALSIGPNKVYIYIFFLPADGGRDQSRNVVLNKEGR